MTRHISISAMLASGKPRQLSVQQRAVEERRKLAKSQRFRVQLDVEGFPLIPGRYGQIEWFDGDDLAVYTNRLRLFAKLWAIPGVRRHQTGDSEMRAVFPRSEERRVGKECATLCRSRWSRLY